MSAAFPSAVAEASHGFPLSRQGSGQPRLNQDKATQDILAVRGVPSHSEETDGYEDSDRNCPESHN